MRMFFLVHLLGFSGSAWADTGDFADNDGDGYAEVNSDCNDDDASIHPGAVEVCADGIDNDCNGLTDLADACHTPDTGDTDIDSGSSDSGDTATTPHQSETPCGCHYTGVWGVFLLAGCAAHYRRA